MFVVWDPSVLLFLLLVAFLMLQGATSWWFHRDRPGLLFLALLGAFTGLVGAFALPSTGLQATSDPELPRLLLRALALPTCAVLCLAFAHEIGAGPSGRPFTGPWRWLAWGWLAGGGLALAGLAPPGSLVLAAVLITTAILCAIAVVDLARARGAALCLVLAWLVLLGGALIHLGTPDPAVGPLAARQALTLTAAVALVLMSFALADHRWSARRRRQEELLLRAREQQAGELARQALSDRYRLLAAVSHDLRQPLYAISLATQSLLRQRPLRNPGPMLAQLRGAIESADALLDAVNTVALLETGSIKPRLAAFSMQPLLERIDRQFAPLAEAQGLRWTVTPSIEWAWSDAALLERMVTNLVSNAVLYTRQGGVLVSCRRRGTELLVQVWDTGPGFAVEHLGQVFETHFRGEPATDTDNGVGLGLAIVRQSALVLGLQLTVRTRPGHGSCFSLRVPVGLAPPDAVARIAGELSRT